MNFKRPSIAWPVLICTRVSSLNPWQLTPNQLLHGWWVSRMGHPQRTPETGLNMKPRWPLLSSLLFPLPWSLYWLCRTNSAKILIALPALCSSSSILAKFTKTIVINEKWRANKRVRVITETTAEPTTAIDCHCLLKWSNHYWGNQFCNRI